jgi:very-short-patch-repair endonuclease
VHVHSSWQDVLDLAADHYGLVTRAQVAHLRVTDRMTERALSDGLLRRVAPAVFCVRGAPQTERMAIAAAVLATRGDASHVTASSLQRFDAPAPAVPIHATVDVDQRHPRLRRIDVETSARSFHPVVVHRYQRVHEPRVVIDGIRCTDAARTLIDLAPMLAVDDLEDAFERARLLGLVSTTALARRFALLGGPSRRGSANVREVLAHTKPSALASKLEGKAWRMIRRSGLSEPVRQLRVDVASGRWYRIDFAWPELLVAVEAEGFEWHGSRARWKADRVRVAALVRLGWRVLIVTWDDVTMRPLQTLDRIAMALDERRRLTLSA